MRSTARRGFVLGALVVATAGLTACGGSDDEKTTSSSTAAVAEKAGPTPTGKPIVLMDISDTTGVPTASQFFQQFPRGEKAAADYINKELGGIGGRPVKILTCDSKLDPGATLACANKAISEGATAQMGLSILFGSTGLRPLEKASIPSLNVGTSKEQSTSPYSFTFGGGSNTEYPAQIQYLAENKGVKSIGVLGDDNPSFRQAVEFMKEKAAEYGVKIEGIFLPANQADPTPTIVKALSAKPDFLSISWNGSIAIKVYQALKQQGWPADKTMNQGGAVDFEALFDKIDPSLIDGAYFTTEFFNPDDTSNPDVAVYQKAIKKYAGVEGKSEFSQWGFSNVMTLKAIAEKIGPDKFDNKSLQAYLSKVEGQKVFMGGTLSKSGAPKEYPAVVQQEVQVVQYKDGKLNTLTPLFNPLKPRSGT